MLLPLSSTQIRVALVLLALIGVVHCQIGTTLALAQGKQPTGANSKNLDAESSTNTAPKILYGLTDLPLPVQQMRDQIIMATKSGQIEDLRFAIEWNELRPAFSADASQDPIDYFKSQSSDGQGLEILGILANILNAGYVALPLGADIENNLIYIWPYFAEIPVNRLSPAQLVELYRIVPNKTIKRMMTTGEYSGYRLSIGADGTWHEFLKGD